MKRGDKCFIVVTNSEVRYNGYPVCRIREDVVYSSGKKFTVVCEKDCFSGRRPRRPQFFTESGNRNWTPKNVHDFYYDFILLDEDTYKANLNGNLITAYGETFLIR